jgi:hypothetical protein
MDKKYHTEFNFEIHVFFEFFGFLYGLCIFLILDRFKISEYMISDLRFMETVINKCYSSPQNIPCQYITWKMLSSAYSHYTRQSRNTCT